MFLAVIFHLRAKVREWKRGFYHIAKNSGMAVIDNRAGLRRHGGKFRSQPSQPEYFIQRGLSKHSAAFG
jgi:hypothetical protein